jgi:ferredoxin-NADP reductase
MSQAFCDRFLTVTKVWEETPETKSLSLDFAGEPFRFVPGQFVNVTVEIPDKGRTRRAYSIASSPLDPELLLTVKRMEPGLLSEYLCAEVTEGDLLHIRGPYGCFTLEPSAQSVFIAAGSGIVPFRSMWRYLLQTRSSKRFSLLYASRSFHYVIYREELTALNAAGFRIIHTFTRNEDPLWTGYSRRIDQEMLLEFVEAAGEKVFYVCGPPEFCACTAQHLLNLSIDRKRIKTEKYD